MAKCGAADKEEKWVSDAESFLHFITGREKRFFEFLAAEESILREGEKE